MMKNHYVLNLMNGLNLIYKLFTMCLLTRQIKPIITKKDMIVIKRLDTNHYNNSIHYSSYYFGSFQYIPKILNIAILGITKRKPIDISSFGDKDHIYYKKKSLINRKLTVIKEGFHFVIEGSDSYEELNDCTLFKFLVPKGSEIFLGKTGCGVSNQIIMLKP